MSGSASCPGMRPRPGCVHVRDASRLGVGVGLRPGSGVLDARPIESLHDLTHCSTARQGRGCRGCHHASPPSVLRRLAVPGSPPSPARPANAGREAERLARGVSSIRRRRGRVKRTRRMNRCRSVTEIARRASSRLNVCEAPEHLLVCRKSRVPSRPACRTRFRTRSELDEQCVHVPRARSCTRTSRVRSDGRCRGRSLGRADRRSTSRSNKFVDALQIHRDALESVGHLGGNRPALQAAGLLKIRELGDLHPVEPDLPTQAPGSEGGRLPVVLDETGCRAPEDRNPSIAREPR